MLARSRVSRQGLTLMELVVVMTILAALAAVAVAMFPNLLRRSHKVVDATNSSEVAKIVQLHQAMYLDYPDQLDLMTVAAGTTAPSFLPNDGGAVFGNGAQIGTLTAAEAGHLGRVGIKNGHHFVATGPGHPTMNPYDPAVPIATPTPLASGTNVFIIDTTTTGDYPQEIKTLIARDATARFVVFGFGARNTAVGTLVQNAPVNPPQNSELTPANHYCRVGVIFQISGAGIDETHASGIAGTKRARFIGACALEDDEIESTEKDLVGYYDVVNSKQ